MWTEVNAILHPKHGDGVDTTRQPSAEVAYMLTSFTLKQTICGEVKKGRVLRRMEDGNVALDYDNSKIKEFHDNLWEMTDHYVAIKVDRRSTMQQIHNMSTRRNPENPWKEVAAMQLLGNSHPHVMGLLGAFMDKQCLYEVMNYCSKGTLSSFIHDHPTGLDEHSAHDIFVQIINGVQYIHSNGICHHDLSTDNVLIDENERCVIIDFGMSLRVPYSYPDDKLGTTDDVTDISIGTNRRLMHTQTHCGKLRFMAPEIYLRKPAFDGYLADVWSIGVILFVLLTGRNPYEKPDISDPGYYDLVDPNYYWNTTEVNPCLSWGHDLSATSIDLLRNMLREDPRERATLTWIMNHKWVKNEFSIIDHTQLEKQLTIQQQ